MTALGDEQLRKPRGDAEQAACCAEFSKYVDDPDAPLDREEQVREWTLYVLPIGDPEEPDWREHPIRQQLFFCPFCGVRFPESVRIEYFERLRAMGFDDPWLERERVPLEYRSDTWWREAGL